MATLTVYPDVSSGATTVDGDVYRAGSDETWAAKRDGAGTNVEKTQVSHWYVNITSSATTPRFNYLSRGLWTFDTSPLTADATISAAVLSIFGKAKDNQSIADLNIDIYIPTGMASNNDIVAADYNVANWGAVSQTGSPITYANWSITAYNDFTFNATGRGNISKTGVSKFGGRNANYDVANTAPTITVALEKHNYLEGYAADQTGTDSDPKLVITYTVSVNDSYNASVLPLTTSQPSAAASYDYTLNVAALGLTAFPQIITQNYDYQYSIATQALSLLQKTPTQNFDYRLSVLAQPLLISNSKIIDSYSESHYDGYYDEIFDADSFGAGQSFTGDGKSLDSCKFYLSKGGSPTGNAVAKIYTHSGTYGTSSIPDTLLATSDDFDVSTLTGNLQLITFNFSGANRIILTNGTHYVVTIEYSSGDIDNHVNVGTDGPNPTHDGNSCVVFYGVWKDYVDWDEIFYVYGSNASVTYDYALSVLAQGLTLEQPITVIETLVEFFASTLALSLTQPTPTYNSSYALAVLRLTLSQPLPFFHWWSKEAVSTTIWIPEEKHN